MKKFTPILLLLCITWGSCGTADETTSVSTNVEESPKAVSVKATEENVDNNLIKKVDLQIMTVSKADQKRSIKVSGRVIPKNTTQLFAEVQGRILDGGVLFKAGVAFNKGDVLLNLDNREFKLALEAQRSAFFNALTGIMPDMKSDYPDNYENWLNYVQNYEFGAALPPLPKALSNNEKYYITSYQIYSQYFNIKSQEERLKKYTITAPYAGIITQSNIDVGSLVTPGQPLGTIINRYSYELEAGVNLSTAQSLKIGDNINFSSNEIAGTWQGKLIRKNNVIDPTTQNIPMYFRLTGKNIRSGMYLEGDYALKSYEDVVTLPIKSVNRAGNVLLLDGEVIRTQPVEIVEYLTESVIVKGLKEGQQVILDNFELPVVGQKVQL